MKDKRKDREMESFARYKRKKELILKGRKKAPGNIGRKLFRPLFRLCSGNGSTGRYKKI